MELWALEAASHRLALYGRVGVSGAVAVGVKKRGAGRVRVQGSHRSARVGAFLMSVVEQGSWRRQSRLFEPRRRSFAGDAGIGNGGCGQLLSCDRGCHFVRIGQPRRDSRVKAISRSGC